MIKRRRRNVPCGGLEKRADFLFLRYPNTKLPNLEHYVLLDLNGPELSKADKGCGLLLIDATWRYSERMPRTLEPQLQNVQRRSLPGFLRKAYPRRQEDCCGKERGWLLFEALYAAYRILEMHCDDILNNYYWKMNFVERNNFQ